MGGYSTGSRAAADLAQPAPWSPSDRWSGPSGRSLRRVLRPPVGGEPAAAAAVEPVLVTECRDGGSRAGCDLDRAVRGGSAGPRDRCLVSPARLTLRQTARWEPSRPEREERHTLSIGHSNVRSIVPKMG